MTQRWGGATVNSVGTGDDAAPAGSWSQRWQYDANYTYFLPASTRRGARAQGRRLVHARVVSADAGGPFAKGAAAWARTIGLYFSNGAPIEVLLYNSPFTSENNVNYQGLFMRDNWRIGDRLTLNLGVRFERYDVFLPEQSKPAGPFSAAGRLRAHRLVRLARALRRASGMSYALTADNRTVVKATYGRFNHAIRPSNTQILRNLNGNEYEATRYRWTDLQRQRHFEYPGELGEFIQTEGGSTTRGIYNPDIEQPRTDEATLRFERQLSASLSARIGYVYKKEFDLYQLVNVARPYSAYNIPITTVDPGPDGVVGNADDGGPGDLLRLRPGLPRAAVRDATSRSTRRGTPTRYNNIEVGVDKRMSDGWQLLASYLATQEQRVDRRRADTPERGVLPEERDLGPDLPRGRQLRRGRWGADRRRRCSSIRAAPAQARDVLYRTGLAPVEQR